MKSPKARKPLFERLKTGLEEAIRHAHGEITLKTTTLEIPDRPPEVGAHELTKLRLKSGMSQAVFARMLNVSTKTVQSWEQGQRRPSQAALRLIQVFRQSPSSLLGVVGMSARSLAATVGNPRNERDLRSKSGGGQKPRARISFAFLVAEGEQMMPQPPEPSEPNPQVERSGTLIETDDDIRQALLSGNKGRQPAPTVPVGPPAQVQAPLTGAARAAVPFRPTARPPVAMLTVFDDGKTDGEVIRIRDHRFIIGRTEGDLCIPLDGRMSARHVEITHQVVGGLHRWVVTDLQSTHGMFVRVSRTVLADRAEFLVGNGRYRFDAPVTDAGPTIDSASGQPGFSATHGWDDGASAVRPPAVTELIGTDIGNRLLLVKNEYWIGSDPSCPICRTDDPFCEPRHVRLYRSSRGAWHAEHHKTPNGLWLRMPQITVESLAQFQIGEQRFQLKVK